MNLIICSGLVRDLLLSNRGRGGAGPSSSPSGWKKGGRGRDDQLVLKVDGHSSTLLKTVVQMHPGSASQNVYGPGPSLYHQHQYHSTITSNGTLVEKPWELVRVQPQVYVKASNNDVTTMRTTTTTTTSQKSGHHHENSNVNGPNPIDGNTQPQLPSHHTHSSTTTHHKLVTADVTYHQDEGQDQPQVGKNSYAVAMQSSLLTL